MSQRNQWIYFMGKYEVAKVNTEVLAPLLEKNGFQRCSYQDYLTKKREIASPRVIEMKGKHQSISIEEELGRR